MYKLSNGFIKIFIISCICILPVKVFTQNTTDTLLPKISLPQCIAYALENQPLINQSKLDEEINKRDIKIALSGWYPSLNIDANFQHYFKLPTAFVSNVNDQSGPKLALPSGLFNTSNMEFSANQTLFSTELLFASRTSGELRKLASQNTQSTRIDIISEVTKSFYDVILSEKQIDILDEDVQRLQQNYKDTYSYYKNGITDKTDYQRTSIALNNAIVQKKTAEESVKTKYELLKQLMGYPVNKSFTVEYDTAVYEKEILLDTSQNLNYDKRIEFQIIQTDLKIQNERVGYFRWSFLPFASAFYDYNLEYANDKLPDLYKINYPNSLIGLKLSFPLFQGANRWQNLNKARLQYKRIVSEQDYLKSKISKEYVQALSSYKSNLNELNISKTNIQDAREIYNTIKLQYDKGIKAYLEVIVAETDLRTSELNYIDVLFRVLSSKIDVEKALGNIK